MNIKITMFVLLTLLIPSLEATAQYIGPESIVFDYDHDRYFVANYGSGKIHVLDMAYNPIDSITGQGHCLGMCIVGGTLYVSCNSYVRGFDLETFERTMNVTCQLAGHFDGQTSANDGYIYVIDTGGWLVRIDITEQQARRYMQLDMPGNPQDCVYDPINNRIVVVTYSTNASIKAVDLADSSILTVMPESYAYCDGITIDDEGNFYISTNVNQGCIFKYDNAFYGEVELVSRGHNQPAGLYYNTRDDILAVPNYGSNTVDFIQLATDIADILYLPNDLTIDASYPNPFNSQTKISYSLESAGNVTINLYNTLGQYIEQLYTGYQSAGRHDLTWQADGYASGIYFCRISTNKSSSIVRMIHLK